MTARREAAWCYAAAAAFAAFLAWMNAWSPPLLDDWIPLMWHRFNDLAVGDLVPYTIENYVSHNPRIGDTFLLLVNGSLAFHVVVTTLFQVALPPLLVMFALGRRVRPTFGDLRMLVIAQALIWLMFARPGVIYFYRPHTVNYLFPMTAALLLVVPYRFELLREAAGPARHWLVPLWLLLGLAVGFGNEHVGPAMMLAVAVLCIAALRRRRLRPWMMAGAVGVWIGAPLLITAPGQSVRYGGMALRKGSIDLLLERGVDGNFELVQWWFADAALGFVFVALVVLAYVARGAAAGRPSRGALLTMLAFVAVAAVIVGTIAGSPSITDRLFVAPTVLLVAAALVLVDHLRADRGTCRLAVVLAVVALAVHVAVFIRVYGVAHREWLARDAVLRATPAGEVARVRPYRHWRYSRWFFGDDFRLAPMRAYVATEVYGLRGIELEPAPSGTEPTPPEVFPMELVYEPPVPPARIAGDLALPLTFWRWTINYCQRTMDRFRHVPGHTLVAARAWWPDARLQFPQVGKRPVEVMRWHRDPDRWRGDFEVLDGREVDRDGHKYLALDRLPPGWTEMYAGGCGQVMRVHPVTIDGIVHVPVDVPCVGMVNAVVCWPDRCWFGGRFWSARPPPWTKGANRVQKS